MAISAVKAATFRSRLACQVSRRPSWADKPGAWIRGL